MQLQQCLHICDSPVIGSEQMASSCYSQGKTEAERDEVTDLKVYH